MKLNNNRHLKLSNEILIISKSKIRYQIKINKHYADEITHATLPKITEAYLNEKNQLCLNAQNPFLKLINFLDFKFLMHWE